MAGVTALRDAAREAIFSSGRRGFVRFCAEGDALLVSDACRRGDEQAILCALRAAGFTAEVQESLLYITPGDALLLQLCASQPKEMTVAWGSPLWEPAALSARLMRETPLPLDNEGRRLLVETARLLWQPREKVLRGLPALRARIAVHLRLGNRSGLYETGRLLGGWLRENMNEGGRNDEA